MPPPYPRRPQAPVAGDGLADEQGTEGQVGAMHIMHNWGVDNIVAPRLGGCGDRPPGTPYGRTRLTMTPPLRGYGELSLYHGYGLCRR